MAAGLNLPRTRRWPPAELTVANPLIWTITVFSHLAFDRKVRYPCRQGPKGQFLDLFSESFNPARWRSQREAVLVPAPGLGENGSCLNVHKSV